jgi:hypothetical protein
MNVHEHSGEDHGLSEALRYPLFNAIFHRRSRRISQGIRSVPAGSLSYTSNHDPQPLTPLEEALLIATTGVTGVTLPDMPFQTEEGKPLVGSPMVAIRGRAASSPDNAQATHFFLINDSGTYFLRQPKDVDPFTLSGGPLDADRLIAYAEACKVKVLDHRLDFPERQFPVYVGRNRYVSNVPGSTVLVPVIDMTQQYVNGLMFLLTQDEGRRPTFIDDWNLYRPAGVKKWIKNGFLNKKLRLPLGYLGTFRIHIEADLLLQNLLLAIQAMGLGGWVHAAFAGPYLLGAPESVAEYGPGLGFRFEKPKRRLRRTLKAFWPMPCWSDNPVGLDGVLETYTPPYYPDMSAAIDAIVAHKYGPDGLYKKASNFDSVFKPGLAARFVEEVPHYREEVIAVAKDVCSYIWDTYGRFPAHVDAVYVPGVWVQAHHLDLAYYDQLYRDGYTATQAEHQRLWHGHGGNGARP